MKNVVFFLKFYNDIYLNFYPAGAEAKITIMFLVTTLNFKKKFDFTFIIIIGF